MVHYIVMKQGRGMDILNQAGEQNIMGACVAGESRAQNEQQRANSLSPTVEDMCGNDIHQGNFRIQILTNLIFDRGQFCAITFPNIAHSCNHTRVGAVRHPRILGEPQRIVKVIAVLARLVFGGLQAYTPDEKTH